MSTSYQKDTSSVVTHQLNGQNYIPGGAAPFLVNGHS